MGSIIRSAILLYLLSQNHLNRYFVLFSPLLSPANTLKKITPLHDVMMITMNILKISLKYEFLVFADTLLKENIPSLIFLFIIQYRLIIKIWRNYSLILISQLNFLILFFLTILLTRLRLILFSITKFNRSSLLNLRHTHFF